LSKLIIEIHDPHIKPQAKFYAAVEQLAKATGFKFEPDHRTSEPSPYKALHQLDDRAKDRVKNRLERIFEAISHDLLHVTMRKSGEDEPFTFRGKLYINPETGTVLTIDEWKQISAHLTFMFGQAFTGAADDIVGIALSLGSILNLSTEDEQVNRNLHEFEAIIAKQSEPSFDLWQNIQRYAELHAGELIQDLTDHSRSVIMQTLIDGEKNGISSKELQRNLFNRFDSLNRDWRRIAETETATNFNNGYLLSEIDGEEDHAKPIFMRGLSAPNACQWCRSHVNDKLVVLLSGPPKGGDDNVEIGGREYTAIWPGKTNYGRKAAEYWVAAGVQHVHCRCTWTRDAGDDTPFRKRLHKILDDRVAESEDPVEE